MNWEEEPTEQSISAQQEMETTAKRTADLTCLQRRPEHSPFCECVYPDWDSSEQLTKRKLVCVTKPLSHDPLKLEFTLPKNEKLEFHMVRKLKRSIGQWKKTATRVTVMSAGKGVEEP